jgi:F-box-like
MLIVKKMLFQNFPDEILLHICSNLTSHELYQLSLSCRALSRVAFSILSYAIRLDYAYRDDQSLPQLNEIITKLKRRSGGFLSDITIAQLSWPIRSELGRRMQHILSTLPSLQTLSLKEHFGSLQGFYLQNPLPIGREENLYDVLLRAPSASTIRSLAISDTRISSHDILKLFSMKQLEHLSIDRFNYPMGIEPAEKIPPSRLESLAISTSAKPTGRHVGLILGRMQRLKRFAWSFDFGSVLNQVEFRRVLSPGEISIALSPLRTTLEELNISMAPAKFENDGTGLDLSGFERLKRVKVHEQVLFAAFNEPGNVGFCPGIDKQLWERLPRTLERLEVSLLHSSFLFCHFGKIDGELTVIGSF